MKLTLTRLQRRLVRRVTLPLLSLLVALVVFLQLQPLLSFLAHPPPDTPLPHFRMQVYSAGFVSEAGSGGGRWFRAPNCSVVEFLAGPDPTVRQAYDPALVCGPPARDRDVICSTFFQQIDVRDDGDCVRPHDDTRVPRYVYFIIFGTFEFKFLHYVSFVAAKRFIRPRAMYLIGDVQPFGAWWERLRRDVRGLRLVHRPRPPTIANRTVRFKQHLSDLVRLQTLLLNGGIYLDADMVMVRDPGPLLGYDLTMGLIENVTGMGNAFMAVKRNNDFIREWYQRYNHFNNVSFYNNSMWKARDMWRRHPHRVHMESHRLYRPNWFEAHKLFKGWDYDWRQNYAVHVWTNGNRVPRSEEEIQTSNTTVAQIFRNALYGDPAPRSSPGSVTSPKARTEAWATSGKLNASLGAGTQRDQTSVNSNHTSR